jgi:hypothetical protein
MHTFAALRHVGWAIPSALLLRQVWSQKTAPLPNRRHFLAFLPAECVGLAILVVLILKLLR